MRSWKNWIMVVGIVIAVMGMATIYSVGKSPPHVQCLTIPCSYFDGHHRQFLGTCGGKREDLVNCYCFQQQGDIATGRASGAEGGSSQIQSGCER